MEEIIDQDVKKVESLTKELSFPYHFEFKISSFSNDFTAYNSKNQSIAYVRQKMFKFKEDVVVFENDSKAKELFRIKADRWIDFNANYAIYDASGTFMGSLGRKGMRSLWKANYLIFDQDKQEEYTIGEENPWAKVGDALLGEIPVVNFFTGYLCNPRYVVKDKNGQAVIRLSKEASFWGRNFKIEKLADFPAGDIERVLLSLMMMILLERQRG